MSNCQVSRNVTLYLHLSTNSNRINSKHNIQECNAVVKNTNQILFIPFLLFHFYHYTNWIHSKYKSIDKSTKISAQRSLPQLHTVLSIVAGFKKYSSIKETESNDLPKGAIRMYAIGG